MNDAIVRDASLVQARQMPFACRNHGVLSRILCLGDQAILTHYLWLGHSESLLPFNSTILSSGS